MAFPTIRELGSESGEITTTALQMTLILPRNHAEGDLLIIGVSLDGSRTMSAPSGWTLLANPTNHTTNRHAVWYRTRGATQDNNVTVTWDTTAELGTWYTIAITSGTWSGTPEVATANGATNQPNAPSLTPSWGAGDTLWLALHGWDRNRTSTTDPTNYTLLTYQSGSTYVGSAGHRTHYRAVNATSEDPSNITISSSDQWYAHTVAVREYVEPSGGPDMSVNIGGTWKTVSAVYVNIGGTWKDATEVHANIGGTWKKSGT